VSDTESSCRFWCHFTPFTIRFITKSTSRPSTIHSPDDDDRASPDRFYQQMHLRIFQTLLHHASSLDASADRERMMRFLMEVMEVNGCG
jgi:hypothetical protein